jgi:hypothetical protein
LKKYELLLRKQVFFFYIYIIIKNQVKGPKKAPPPKNHFYTNFLAPIENSISTPSISAQKNTPFISKNPRKTRPNTHFFHIRGPDFGQCAEILPQPLGEGSQGGSGAGFGAKIMGFLIGKSGILIRKWGILRVFEGEIGFF